MPFVSSQPIVLIGPGSEWIWTAISTLVLAITFLAIYRQLRVARSANAFEQLRRVVGDWDSERGCRHILAINVALRGGAKPDELPFGPVSFVADFWDSLGTLVKEGHVDRRIVYEYMGNSVRLWWAELEPMIHRLRTEFGDPRGASHFEWLKDLVAEMDRQAGVAIEFDLPYVRKSLDRRIENDTDRLRVEEELRAVVLRPTTGSSLPEPAAEPSTRTRRMRSPARAG
jgi:hypothetical protein